jgi:hypothetical protein
MRRVQRGRAVRVRRAVTLGVTLTAAGAVAACGSSASSSSGPATTTSATVSMATSTATSTESWAVLPMASNPTFWQIFSRTGNSPDWKLVTPPGVAINGGIVAAAGATSGLTAAVLPSHDLTFTPLAATANGGVSWTTPDPIGSAVAPSPGALAADGSNLATVLSDGTIETSASAGTSWSTLAKPGAIAASPAAKGCGAFQITGLSFGSSSANLLAAGTCGTGGTAAVFSYSPGTGWQRQPLPVSGQLVQFGGGTALVDAKAGLTELSGGTGWTSSAPLPVSGTVTASGSLMDGGAWALLSGGRAAVIDGAGQSWQSLPTVPTHTAVLAAGPAGAIDALAVSGSTLTVWQLASGTTAWSRVEAVNVPIQYGSSS